MKQVFKCDFCSTTNPDSERMKNHENGCNFNPENKTCMSCKHSFMPRFCDWFECNRDHDSSHMDDVQFNSKPCQDWEKEDD